MNSSDLSASMLGDPCVSSSCSSSPPTQRISPCEPSDDDSPSTSRPKICLIKYEAQSSGLEAVPSDLSLRHRSPLAEVKLELHEGSDHFNADMSYNEDQLQPDEGFARPSNTSLKINVHRDRNLGMVCLRSEENSMPPPRSAGVSQSFGRGKSGSGGGGGGSSRKESKRRDSSEERVTSSIPDLEFDGTTVLCRVCGDKASGFHYGVHSCEGCKGFFRRSIQQKIQYRPCTKNQQCVIQRVNRNRCQYCRLKKCIAVGMSRDAVRFGRVPKREKARIIAAMQSVQTRTLERSLLSELDDEAAATLSIIQAFLDTSEFTKENNRQLRSQAMCQPVFTPDPNSTSCPLFPTNESVSNSSTTFTMRFSRAIRGVINFSLRLPVFSQIPTDDRMLLLKAGAFEALLVCLAGLFESSSNTFLCMNGRLISKDSMTNSSNTRFLMDSMCDYADRMNRLQLADSEIALFTAVVIVAPDRPGIRNRELVERIHKRFDTFLQNELSKNHPDQPGLYRELVSFIPDLRTLNTLHSDKYFCQKKPELPISNHGGYYDEPRSMWDDKETSINSPSSTCSNDEAMRSPDSESSGCSEGSVCGNEVSTFMGNLSFTQHRQKREPSESSSSGDEAIVDSYNNNKNCPFMKRKVESPNDSGIEHDKISLSSVTSSPRSSVDEKIEEDREEDMPVLRRALQAPPIMNTDLIMEEAYKPHKKFRALRREEEPHSSLGSSILAHTLSQSHYSAQPSSSSSSLLASALSAPSLAKTLSEQPKMPEDLLRRADMIHTLMVKKESLCQRSQKAHRSSRASPAPHYSSHSLKERLQSPSPTWSCSSNRNGISSSVPEIRAHLLTAPTPSRYYEPRRPISTPSSMDCHSSMNPSSPSSLRSYGSSPNPSGMELQVDISDSQPLNLSKKTPTPPPSAAYEMAEA